MLENNTGKFVRYSTDGQCVLVVYSKPLGYQGIDHVMMALKAVGTLQRYGDHVFCPFSPSDSGQKNYWGNEAPAELRAQHGEPEELIFYKPLVTGWTIWENAGKYVTDRETDQKIEFPDISEECPLIDGEGWTRFQSWRNHEHYLSVRETPYYNRDVVWNPSSSKSGRLPFHFASFGYETANSARPTASSSSLVGHLSSFRDYSDLTTERLTDPTLRDELRVS